MACLIETQAQRVRARADARLCERERRIGGQFLRTNEV